MNTKARTAVLCLAVASAAIAAKPSVQKRLTPKRIAELAAPLDAPKAKSYAVEITGLEWPAMPGNGAVDKNFQPVPASKVAWTKSHPGRVNFSMENPNPTAVLEMTRELRYPIEFSAPQASADGTAITAPVTPKTFGSTTTGWTVHLSPKPAGNLIALSGTADFAEAEILNGGYGALAGPIYSEKGNLMSPNVFHQPRIKTTSTRFFIFAAPGEPYEITVYRGDKEEKMTLTVIAE